MPTQKLTAEIIAAAIDDYEFQKARIDGKIWHRRSRHHAGSAPPEAKEILRSHLRW